MVCKNSNHTADTQKGDLHAHTFHSEPDMTKVIFEISKVGRSSRKMTEKVNKVIQTVDVKRKILRIHVNIWAHSQPQVQSRARKWRCCDKKSCLRINNH